MEDTFRRVSRRDPTRIEIVDDFNEFDYDGGGLGDVFPDDESDFAMKTGHFNEDDKENFAKMIEKYFEIEYE